jgi:seryl-tRNA synthetase
MLDIRFIRENPELVQDHAQKKGYEVNITELLELYATSVALEQKQDALREEKNSLSARQSDGRPSDEVIERGRAIRDEIQQNDEATLAASRAYQAVLWQIPNVMQPDVPVGREEDSVEIKQWGQQTSGAIDHLDFAVKRDWVDFERGAKVAGAKFYYLKGDLALLENAITQFALNLVLSKGLPI